MESRAIIEVRDVSQTFDTPSGFVNVLTKVNLTIFENTINILYGPSGSGKSTLLHILSGLQKPTQGSVIVEGRDIYSLDHDELAKFRANRMGMVYQSNYWVKSLNVLDNVSLPLNFLGYTRPKAHVMGLEALTRVGMQEYADKEPYNLSGGEQQRIAMARAIAATPLIIMADEPTGNLDVANGDRIIELLQVNKEQLRSTIVLVTHNIEYLPLADHVFHIENGIAEEIGAGDVAQASRLLLHTIEARMSARMSKNKQHTV